MTRRIAVKNWLPVIAVLLLVTAVGAWNLNADGIWYDEWWSLYNAGAAPFTDPLAPAQIWDRLAADDPWQTPGYPLLLSAWGNLVGWTELAGRALSLFGGLVAVALTYRFASALTRDSLAALAAAVLLGASSMFLYFTHELRGYTFYLACSVALFYSYWRVATRPNRGWLSYAAVALSGTLLIYLHPFSFVVFGAIGLWHLARLLRRDSWHGWMPASIALAIPLIAFLPWLNVLLGAAAATRDAARAQVDAQSLAQIATRTLDAFSNAAVPLFALFALFSFRRRASGFLWGVVLLLTPITLAAYAVTRLSEPRYGIAIQPFLAMIGGLGVAALHRRKVPAAALLALWIAPAVLLSRDPALGKVIQDFYPQPVREMAQILKPYLTDEAAVLNYLGYGFRSEQQQTVLVYYLGRPNVSVLEMETSRTLGTFTSRLDAALGSADHLWLLYSPIYPGSEWALVQYLLEERGYYPCQTLYTDANKQIYAYGRLDTASPALRFGDQIVVRLIGEPQRTDAGLLVWLGLTSAAPPDTYSIGLHVTDANGTLVAQDDTGLPAGDQSCLLFDLPVQSLPPGDYQVEAVIYDWRTGERLPSVGFDGESTDNPALMPLTLP